MFWKKKPAGAKPAGEAKPKERKLSPKETIMKQIQEITPGQEASFQPSALFGDSLIFVRLNSDFPTKGKKYLISMEAVRDGKSTGNVVQSWDSSVPETIADWIIASQRTEL